jgi:hypothetical protein
MGVVTGEERTELDSDKRAETSVPGGVSGAMDIVSGLTLLHTWGDDGVLSSS